MTDISRYTLRVSRELLDKIGYIAEYDGRTKNKEIEQLIKKRIQAFEKIHGEIDVNSMNGSSVETD